MNWQGFNINDQVRVKLTEVGLKRYRAIREDLRDSLPPVAAKEIISLEPKLDDEGFYSDSLWSLMHDFGDLCGLGMLAPFESCQIQFEVKA